MKEIKYCRECGTELLKSSCGADEIKIWYPDCMGGSMFRVDSPFDEKTGERNIVEVFTCLKWKGGLRGLFNSHDKIVKYKDECHWL
jgi:hypothetical protein